MDRKSILQRIRSLILFPKWEWKTINLEKRPLKDVFMSFAFPLILIGAASQFIGSFLFVKNEMDIDAYRFSLPLIHAGYFIFVQVVSLMLTTVFVFGLSEKFLSEKDYSRSGKLVVYSFTPVYLLYILANLHVSLGFLMIPALYSIVLFWTGLPIMIHTPARKVPAYVFIIFISVFGILFISSRLLAFLSSLIFPGAL